MSTIVLEQIEQPEEHEEPEEPQPPEITLEPHEAEIVEQSQVEIVPTPPPAPAFKKRGRPPKAKTEAPPPAPKVKVAPKPKTTRKPKPLVEDSSDSSDVDDTLRNVYNHVAKPYGNCHFAIFGQSKTGRKHSAPRTMGKTCSDVRLLFSCHSK